MRAMRVVMIAVMRAEIEVNRLTVIRHGYDSCHTFEKVEFVYVLLTSFIEVNGMGTKIMTI